MALRRSNNEPASAKLQRFINAKQNPGEEVRFFVDCLTFNGEDPVKTQLHREILAEQLSWFLAGLRDRVRRFVLSHEPTTFEEAVEVAAREERIDKLCAQSIHHGSDNAEERELQNRLDRLEKVIKRSLGLSGHEREVGQRRSMRPPLRCYDYGQSGHIV
ncbi:hypothetical protein HPB50_009309 [Hyalomma asiaticum]|uniref:Uncharacterized protein n=1 Tax=Hyalomma asiaticum TaxID=266040 RepID=A0ACB7TFD1_HYAAI|nr:hypothetical protein HPB50_009309 [Hyalomma asiaticum]